MHFFYCLTAGIGILMFDKVHVLAFLAFWTQKPLHKANEGWFI